MPEPAQSRPSPVDPDECPIVPNQAASPEGSQVADWCAGNASNDPDSTPQSFRHTNLTEVRNRLLDLTARNRLLNHKHTAVKSVRFVATTPDAVWSALSAGKTIPLTPVPEPTDEQRKAAGLLVIDADTGDRTKDEPPTAEAWARYLNIPVTYELGPTGDEKNSGTGLKGMQSLLFRDALDGRLRKIKNLASASVEERGASILYVVTGFLEWFESPHSDEARLAPLVVEPVKLTKTNSAGVQQYALAHGDEDALGNLCLAEKLSREFGITLPERNDEEALTEWFVRVENTVHPVDPRWRIRQRVSLCLLDFTKQAMYQDLDASIWPEGEALEDHPIIARFFSASAADSCTEEERHSESTNYLPEHSIDSLKRAQERYPLIADADSSQHSAIVDAVDGRNLVIEGPPGTGKSQTITNLIAAAMASGKRVLFVAEKMDALEVVARRLREANLGDFLLELHSHKTNKPDLLASLVSAAEKRGSYTAPAKLEDQIRRLESIRSELSKTAKTMNTPWRKTGFTPHQILQRATERRDLVPPTAPQLQGIDVETLGSAMLEEAQFVAKRLVQAFEELSTQAEGNDVRKHLWYGVNRSEFMGAERDALFAALEIWNDRLAAIIGIVQGLADQLGPTASASLSPAAARQLAHDLARLPESVTAALLVRTDELADQHQKLDEMRKTYQALRSRFGEFAGTLRVDHIENEQWAARFRSGLGELREKMGASDSLALKGIEAHSESLGSLDAACSAMQSEIDSLADVLPSEMRPALQPTKEGWDLLATVLELVNGLPRELWSARDTRLDHPDIATVLSEFERVIRELNSRKDGLSNLFELDCLPCESVLGSWQRTLNNAGMFGWVRAEVRSVRRSVKALAISSRTGNRELAEALSTLRRYRQTLDDLDAIHQNNPLLGSLYVGVNTPFARLRTLSNWYSAIAGHFRRGRHGQAPIGAALRELDAFEADALITAIESGLPARLRESTDQLARLEGLYPRFFAAQAKDCAITSTQNIRSAHDGEPEVTGSADGDLPHTLIGSLQSDVAGALAKIQPVLDNADLSLGELYEQGNAWQITLDDARAWRDTPQYAATVPSLFDLKLTGISHRSPAEVDLDAAISLGVAVASSPLLAEVLRRPDPQVSLARLLSARDSLRDACTTELSARAEFMRFGEVDETCWFHSGEPSLEGLLESNRVRLEHRPWLETWLSWQRVKARKDALCLVEVVGSLERGELDAKDVPRTIEADVYSRLADHLMAEEADVAAIEGLHQNSLRDQFAEVDRDIQKLQRARIAHLCSSSSLPSGNGRGVVSSYTQMSLIHKEHSKKTRHIAIRQLMSRASDAIAALKPCFMMSPMSVAQYLEPGAHKFDLIVMDEASQIKPEEALGAIGRAEQLIVVGDPRQLPPTSFFDAATGEADDEQDVGLQQSESVLDAVLPLFDKRRLRWHYRSRHPSLIAFSNYHFYDSNLVLFPSPRAEGDEFGVRFRRVADGCCEAGTNLAEAEEIANFLAEQLVQRPDESVGVVAMNVKQAEAIEVAIEARARADQLVAEALDTAAKSSSPLFVKNLERVQGDERDVIVISMTYGPLVPGGTTAQRFGPINSAIGWRRLNVLLTRSKKRMQVFSSMGSADILDTGTPSRGKTALKNFLHYCENGHLNAPVPTDREPDSAFEIAVMRRLAEYGYEAEPQLGVAGFFLDLAVRDPDNPGRYLLAIECDGATYHAAKSARDRDRLRQEILENLGWQVHRIWSTDWFRNPEAQMVAVLKKLDGAQRGRDCRR